MSYDIYLTEPVSGDTIELPIKHVMIGGTYAADYNEKTGDFTPKPISEAHLNITYNYSIYYYEATDRDSRFAHDEISAYYADGTIGPVVIEYGIRGIYGKTGAQSISMLKDMIERIIDKYKKDGKWITTTRKRSKYIDNTTGEELNIIDILHMKKDSYHKEEYTEEIDEGENSNYWEPTAINAIKPLYQLIAMAELRPDGIWKGD